MLIDADEMPAVLVKAFQEVAGKSDEWETVEFKIVGDTLWKNDVLDVRGRLFHAISIPYEAAFNKVNPGFGFNEATMHLRIVVVSGILKLQFGLWPRWLDPPGHGSGYEHIYQLFEGSSGFRVGHSSSRGGTGASS